MPELWVDEQFNEKPEQRKVPSIDELKSFIDNLREYTVENNDVFKLDFPMTYFWRKKHKDGIKRAAQEQHNKFQSIVKEIQAVNKNNSKSISQLDRSISIVFDEMQGSQKKAKELTKIVSLIEKFLSLSEDEASSRIKEFEKFKSLIQNDFMEYANKDEFICEAQTYQQLLEIEADIEKLVYYDFLVNKTVIGVGGQFSSGKSRFINSLLKTPLLPCDTKPTTSVPTYITQHSKARIEINTYADICVEISEDDFKSITHQLYDDYRINCMGLINSAVVYTPIMNHENIAILDTPGYTKADFHKKTDKTDRIIAKKQLENTDALFWLVDIENGTIQESDIAFIKDMNYKNPIYFVVNKADKKNESTIPAILAVVEDELKKREIQYDGIIAYSSYKDKEYQTIGSTLSEYITCVDKVVDRDYKLIKTKLHDFFNRYDEFYKERKNKTNATRGLLNKVSTKIDDDMAEKLGGLIKEINTKDKIDDQLIEELNVLKIKFYTQLGIIFDVLSQ